MLLIFQILVSRAVWVLGHHLQLYVVHHHLAQRLNQHYVLTGLVANHLRIAQKTMNAHPTCHLSAHPANVN